jgi:hypothetical protein
MQITSVSQKTHRSHIQLPDLDSVKAALVLFSEGTTESSHATKQQLVADGGGLAAMLLSASQRNTNGFLDQLFKEIEETIEVNSSYNRHFDYDGYGSFFKTSVGVDRLPDESYLLSLNAAYVGHKVEDELAEALGLQQKLWWSGVNLTYGPVKGEMFEIDFEAIAMCLAPLGAHQATGSDIAGAIVHGGARGLTHNITPGEFIVAKVTEDSPGVKVNIDRSSVASYYDHPYSVEGSTVRGRLQYDWDNPTKMLSPVVFIGVDGMHAEDPQGWNRFPTLDQKIEEDVLQLTDRIASAFNSYVDVMSPYHPH